MKLNVPGVRHRGRQKKQRRNNIQEDLREKNPREADALEQDVWTAAIKSSNLLALRRRR